MIRITKHAVNQAINRSIDIDTVTAATLAAERQGITDGEYQTSDVRLIIKPSDRGNGSAVVTVTEPRGTGRFRTDSWSSSR